MSKKPTPEELLTQKQKKLRQHRQKNKKYFRNYSKFYYLKNLLADPDYNKKRRQREKELKKSK